jgi:hypothetical protein
MSLNSNLKIDQILRGTKFAENSPRIYSTGTYLLPLKITIRGIDHFVWVADDVFDSDGNNISANVIADTIEELYD